MDTVISIVICLVVLFFFIDGIRRGLVRQIFEIAGLIAAFIGAYYLGHAIAHRFAGSTRISASVVRFFFSAIVFIAIAIAFHLAGLLFQKIVSVTILGPVDRIGGALFGAAKGVLFVSLVCVLLFSVPAAGGLTAKIKANRVAGAMHPVLPRVYNFFMKRSSVPLESSDIVRAQSPRGTL
ncbi:MAG: CvpA family protein [Candidatus Krumholzibacteria bacterium]|nr:CvpA family protein [Candidatus Krumholzibacteria bacterium]